MRTKDGLKQLKEITILLQYLYLDESHEVTVSNGVTDIRIRMLNDFRFTAQNMQFPSLPELAYTGEMTVPNMLAIIEQLKETPAKEFSHRFANRWEEIETLTRINLYKNR